MDRIATEIADMLRKPNLASELLTQDLNDAAQCIPVEAIAALLSAKPGEYGHAIDTFRDVLAGVLAGYDHAAEMAEARIARRDEDCHREEHGAWLRGAA